MQIVTRQEAEVFAFTLDYTNPLTAKVEGLIPVDNSVIPDVSGVLTVQESQEYYANPYAIYQYATQHEDMTGVYGITDSTGTGYISMPKPPDRDWHTFTCEFFINDMPQDDITRLLLGSGTTDIHSTANVSIGVKNSSLRFFIRNVYGVSQSLDLSGLSYGYNKVVVRYRLTTNTDYEIFIESEKGVSEHIGVLTGTDFFNDSYSAINEFFIGSVRSNGNFNVRFIKGVIVNFQFEYETDPTAYNLVYDFNEPNTDYNFINFGDGVNNITLVNIPISSNSFDSEGGLRIGKTGVEFYKNPSRARTDIRVMVKKDPAETRKLMLFGTGSDVLNYPLLRIYLDVVNNRIQVIHKLPNGNDTSYNSSYFTFSNGYTYPDDGEYHEVNVNWSPWSTTRFSLFIDGVEALNLNEAILSQSMTEGQWSDFDHFYFNASYTVYQNTNSATNPFINSAGEWHVKWLEVRYGSTLQTKIDFASFNGRYVFDSVQNSMNKVWNAQVSGIVEAIQAIYFPIGSTELYPDINQCMTATSHIDYVRSVLELAVGTYTTTDLVVSNSKWKNFQPIIKAKNKGEVVLESLNFFLIRGHYHGLIFKSSDHLNHSSAALIFHDPSGATDGAAIYSDCEFLADGDLTVIDYQTRGSSPITIEAQYRRCLFVTGETAGNVCIDTGSDSGNDSIFLEADQCMFISRNPSSGTYALVSGHSDTAELSIKVNNSLFYAESGNPLAMEDTTGNSRITGTNNISNLTLGETSNGQESVTMTNWFEDFANGDFKLTSTAQNVLKTASEGGTSIAAWAYATIETQQAIQIVVAAAQEIHTASPLALSVHQILNGVSAQQIETSTIVELDSKQLVSAITAQQIETSSVASFSIQQALESVSAQQTETALTFTISTQQILNTVAAQQIEQTSTITVTSKQLLNIVGAQQVELASIVDLSLSGSTQLELISAQQIETSSIIYLSDQNTVLLDAIDPDNVTVIITTPRYQPILTTPQHTVIKTTPVYTVIET